MPRYFFDIHDGIEVIDDEGTTQPDVDAARLQALEFATAYTTKRGMLRDDGGAVVVTVRDETGARAFEVRLVFTITNG